MLIQNFLRTRQSTRNFRKREIPKKIKPRLEDVIEDMNEKAKPYKTSFLLSLDGDRICSALEGKAGYSGVMIEAPSYVAPIMEDGEDETILYSAYLTEMLITRTNELDLDNCWISVKDVDKKYLRDLFSIERGEINYLIALGQGEQGSSLEGNTFSERIAVSDYVFLEDFDHPISNEELEDRGIDDLFFYLRYAPSSYNSQDWRFLIRGNKVDLYMDDFKGTNSLTDAGIIMYYYEVMVSYLGISTEWTVDIRDEGGLKHIAQAKF